MRMTRPLFLDAAALASQPLTGIGRYSARLALSLAQLGRMRYFTGGYEILAADSLSLDQEQDLAVWARSVWKGRRIPLEVPTGAVGVYPGPRESIRRFPHEIGILYDFTPLILPGTHAARTKATFSRFYSDGLLANDRVVAISESTRADALWLSDLPLDRITVAYPGPSLCVNHHLDPTPVDRDSHLILSVSTLEPRKNAAFLFDWFSRSKALPEDSELCWVGPIGWLTSRRTLDRLRRSSSRRIRFLGMVSDAELCRLYRRAGTTIYPSLYEGFGFPVLDSLRHGAPVLCSQSSSLAEFEVEGVTFFDPCDVETLDQAWLKSRNRQTPEIDSLDRVYSWNHAAEVVMSGSNTMTSSREGLWVC